MISEMRKGTRVRIRKVKVGKRIEKNQNIEV